MIYRIENFEKKTPSNISFEKVTFNCGETINVYQIETVHDLTQFIGFGKYKNNKVGNVFLRGQTSLYDGSIIPSLYRGKTSLDSITSKYDIRIKNIINTVKHFNKYDKLVFEPLIQHYGIKTPWIDVVDNVWVALWFALHQAKTLTINSREYVYYFDNKNEFSYIYLLASDALQETDHSGVYVGEETKLVDLRKSLPSFFLRPHAQHAYMLRKSEPYPADYSNLIVGVAKIPTRIGMKWLGNNEFLTLSSLFPASYFDSGYAVMLKQIPEEDASNVNVYGSIQILTD